MADLVSSSYAGEKMQEKIWEKLREIFDFYPEEREWGMDDGQFGGTTLDAIFGLTPIAGSVWAAGRVIDDEKRGVDEEQIQKHKVQTLENTVLDGAGTALHFLYKTVEKSVMSAFGVDYAAYGTKHTDPHILPDGEVGPVAKPVVQHPEDVSRDAGTAPGAYDPNFERDAGPPVGAAVVDEAKIKKWAAQSQMSDRAAYIESIAWITPEEADALRKELAERAEEAAAAKTKVPSPETPHTKNATHERPRDESSVVDEMNDIAFWRDAAAFVVPDSVENALICAAGLCTDDPQPHMPMHPKKQPVVVVNLAKAAPTVEPYDVPTDYTAISIGAIAIIGTAAYVYYSK